ncbi:trifunctional dihydropteroate synthetase [Coemansia spiralis]|uniref:Trifunctional dihydropteroate synthetase n=2 Tax=Coemansia TaxID=4863 RepID=A0A9W8G4Y7_9FUNG|nr:Dihydropteroate synthase-like protein [Coemansia spiralis]KAJ1990088.1 trifunctional dihydropteroate synthetase [Coemansia umbellata]KAJ2623825.1 trifunctional dihydropteroate synthetase [Coemansia sp. RSA 1358]KAJ2675290.1 trifunctional dihydropteroate synthetase [Coemansia spiralis]
MADKILFRDLQVSSVLGNDVWERRKKLPLSITCEIRTSIASAGKTDKINTSVHYGLAGKRVTAFAESDHKLQSLEAFSEGVARECLNVSPRAFAVRVIVNKPRALLHAESVGIEIFRTREDIFGSWGPEIIQDKSESSEAFAQRLEAINVERAAATESAGILVHEDQIHVKKLSLSTIIGINLWERHYKQLVNIDLTLSCAKPSSIKSGRKYDTVPRYRNYRTVVDAVTELVEKSSYRTVEALVTAIARTAIKQCKVPKITVRVEKPSAMTFAACTGAEITRTADDFTVLASAYGTPSVPSTPVLVSSSTQTNTEPTDATEQPSAQHSAYIALGTNVGDRLGNLHQALLRLNNDLPQSRLVETSFLYETAPMYEADQPQFLNAACLLKTDLEPLMLLDELKRIEVEMGRDFSMYRNGPRVIDLDILFYDEIEMVTDKLTIPHTLLHERRFQLGPLCDIDCDLMHHRMGKTSGTLYRHLTTHDKVPDDIVQVTPLKARWHTRPNAHEGCILKALNPKQQKETAFMGILNCTPDSFSDGGVYDTLENAVRHAKELFGSGADIIDIGGQSTRPGATQVGVEEEIRRIIPVIKRIREEGIEVPISVDTFYADVAAAALDAGADIVNDVTGGYADPNMLPLVAQRQCPYILMHMRGGPSTMKTLNDYTEYDGDVVRGIRYEIAQRVRAAIDKGVARWNIIIDPGIGFAKEGVQNFEVLRRLPALTARNIHASAKSKGSSNAEEIAEDLNTDVDEQGFVDENLATELVNYPVLVGSSRKRFIGNVTDRPNAKDRVWGTAATVTAAIQGGASIVRVHDVAEMLDVACVSDNIYRL